MRIKQAMAGVSVLAVTLGAGWAETRPVAAAAPSGKAMTCYQALLDVDERLAPVVAAAGARTRFLVAPWDPEASSLVVGEEYDAEVTEVADGTIEMHLNCATTRPVSRRQRLSAFRFLVLHEYAHVLQRAYGFPSFDPQGEHSADCAAVLLMWSWRWPMPSGALQGSHGGCPGDMWVPAYDWLTGMGIAL